jgi:acetyl-CoA acetyltransferase
MYPAPATRRLCERLGLTPNDFDHVELNEAFASQNIAVLRELGLPEDAEHINPNRDAIAISHPVGMSGARVVGILALELSLPSERRALGNRSRAGDCHSARASLIVGRPARLISHFSIARGLGRSAEIGLESGRAVGNSKGKMRVGD